MEKVLTICRMQRKKGFNSHLTNYKSLTLKSALRLPHKIFSRLNNSGSVILENAIILPVFIFAVFAAFEFGYYMLQNVSVHRSLNNLANEIRLHPDSFTHEDALALGTGIADLGSNNNYHGSVCAQTYKIKKDAEENGCHAGQWDLTLPSGVSSSDPYYVATAIASEAQAISPIMDKLINYIYVHHVIKIIPTTIVPPGSILPFDLDDCPAGWSRYSPANGRKVLGTGFSGTGQLPDAHTLGKRGGLEKHQMSLTELVPHNHVFWRYSGSSPYEIEIHQTDNGGSSAGSGDIEQTRNNAQDKLIRISNTGGDPATGQAKPFNITDPYIALTYCKKN